MLSGNFCQLFEREDRAGKLSLISCFITSNLGFESSKVGELSSVLHFNFIFTYLGTAALSVLENFFSWDRSCSYSFIN